MSKTKVYKVELEYKYHKQFKVMADIGSFWGLQDYTNDGVEKGIKQLYEWYANADKEKYVKFLSLEVYGSNHSGVWHYPDEYGIYVVGAFLVRETLELKAANLAELDQQINYREYEIKSIEIVTV